jgi:phosphoribosylanthranilate isomerase
MAVPVKICGLSTPDTLDVAIEAGADMLGFVFFPRSPRHLSYETARSLGQQARGRALKVALSVDASDDQLSAMIAALQPDYLQLHGQETPERARTVRTRFGIPIMKALPIASAADLGRMGDYAETADRLILDARPPREATRPGGLGSRFDWHLLEHIETEKPFILSGGLDPGNVAEALRITRAQGVDVSSGVERAPGEKDADKIRAFIAAVRTATTASDRMILA